MCAFDIPAQVRRRKADAEKTSLYNGVSSRASGFKVHVTIDGTSYQVSDESEVEDRIVLATGSSKPLNFEWQRKPTST